MDTVDFFLGRDAFLLGRGPGRGALASSYLASCVVRLVCWSVVSCLGCARLVRWLVTAHLNGENLSEKSFRTFFGVFFSKSIWNLGVPRS